jgi:hypothetical protein
MLKLKLIFLISLFFPLFAQAQFKVQNFRFYQNTISTSNTNGDVHVNPNGTGKLILDDEAASRVLVTDSNKGVVASSTTTTVLGYLDISSSLTTLLGGKVNDTGDTMTGNLVMNAQSDVRFADSDSDHYVGFQSPATVSSDILWTLPSVDGGSGQFLTTNGSATLSWATASTENFQTVQNLGIATSVGSSALTITLKQVDGSSDATALSPVKIPFRSSTTSSGAFNVRSVTAALSLVVSSGSTLGSTSAAAHNYYVYAIDNSGTVELAVSQMMHSCDSVISTTAEGGAGAADSNTVIYSTTARSNVPCRVIGVITATEATAGTWATNSAFISVNPQTIVHKFHPYFKVGGTPSGTLNGSFNNITFGTESADPHNMFSTATATIPVAGMWCFSYGAGILGNNYSVGNNAGVTLAVGGSSLTPYADDTQRAWASSNISLNPNGHFCDLFNVGDAVTVQSTSNATGPTYVAGSGKFLGTWIRY